MNFFRFLFFIGLAGQLAATVTQFRTYDTAADFFRGKSEGAAVTLDGRLIPWLKTTRVAEEITDKELWDLAWGEDRELYIATGNPAAVHCYATAGGKVELKRREKLDETVLAVSKLAWDPVRKKMLYARIPDGKVCAFPDELVAQLPAKYVYDLLPAGENVFVLTGPEAALWRIDAAGKFEKIFQVEEDQFASVIRYEKSLFIGCAKSGKVYAMPENGGTGRVCAFFPGGEVRKLASWNNRLFAGVNTGAGGRNANAAENNPAAHTATSGESSAASRPAPAGDNAGGGGFKIYELDGDETRLFAEMDQQVLRDFGFDTAGALIAALDQPARLVRIINREYAVGLYGIKYKLDRLLFDNRGNLSWLGGNKPAGLYRVVSPADAAARYFSDMFDTGALSKFGVMQAESAGQPEFAYRAGNSPEADSFWSAWSPNPAGLKGRYGQFRVQLPESAALNNITLSYSQVNLPPILKEVNLERVTSRNFSQLGGQLPMNAPALQSLQQFFQSSQTIRAQQPALGDFFKSYGLYLVSWRVQDPNRDRLVFELFYKYEDAGWVKIKTDRPLTEAWYLWNTANFPDGRYRLKVNATDETDNTGSGRTVECESAPVLVDNAPPDITVAAQGKKLQITVRDALSLVRSLEYKIDNGEWRRLVPLDGLYDDRTETFEMEAPTDPGTLSFRAADAADNFRIESRLIRRP